jgi:hypothetical protein
MNTEALILWLATSIAATGMACFFFIKVLTSGKNKEPDSYSKNHGKKAYRLTRISRPDKG